MEFDIEREQNDLGERKISRQEFIRKGLLAGLTLTSLVALAEACQSGTTTTTGNPNAGISAPTAFLGGDGSFANALTNGLRVGTLGNLPPYVFSDSTGALTGFDVDLFNEAAKRLGLTDKVKVTVGPWAAQVPSLGAKRLDFILTDFHITPERAAIIDFTGPLFFYSDNLLVPKGNPQHLHSWADLAGHTVGVLTGESYVDWLNARHDLKGIKTYTTFDEQIIDISAGRVDAVLGEAPVTSYYLATHPNATFDIVADYVPHDVLSNWSRWGVQKGAHDVGNAFTRVADEMRVDGTMYTILKKYGMPAQSLQVFQGMPQ